MAPECKVVLIVIDEAIRAPYGPASDRHVEIIELADGNEDKQWVFILIQVDDFIPNELRFELSRGV